MSKHKKLKIPNYPVLLGFKNIAQYKPKIYRKVQDTTND